jgi:hypothetical protein
MLGISVLQEVSELGAAAGDRNVPAIADEVVFLHDVSADDLNPGVLRPQ